MPYIVKLNDHYFEYSDVTDSPVTFGMALDQFVEYYIAEYGRSGFDGLEKRLERVDKHGTSSHWGVSPDDLMFINRAGPDESCLTVDEIYKAYCLREPIRDGWLVPESEGEDELT